MPIILDGTTGTTTPNVVIGNWTITVVSNSLYFSENGINKMKLDSSGNLSVLGNVTAFATGPL
jgi:hypothetical protein